MAHNKLYRNFIILQQDERGYSSANDKSLSGYSKIEAKGDKCKISFYVQNIKKEKNYSMVLICCKKDYKKLINLGSLTVNEVGKGETSKEYYINNIAGIDISYEDISGAALCEIEGKNIKPIMHGFKNGQDLSENWVKFGFANNDFRKTDDNKENKSHQEQIIQNKTIEVKTDKENNLKTDVVDVDKSEKILKVSQDRISEDNENKEINDENKETRNDKKELEDNVSKNEKCDIKEVEYNLSETRQSDDNHLDIQIDTQEVDDEESTDELMRKSKKKYKSSLCDKDKKEDKDKKDDIKKHIDILCKEIEPFEGKIDIKIDNLKDDVVIYGFMRDKKYDKCWKKFKIEKKADEKYYYKEKDDDDRCKKVIGKLDFDAYEKCVDNQKHNYDFQMKGNIGNYFENIAKGFKPYKLAGIDNCKWYKVDVNKMEDLCDKTDYNKYTLAYYPMINYYPYIINSRYFLIGYKCNDDGELEYIIYGIEGSKEKTDQPYGGQTGFVTWMEDKNTKKGYWLMFYDYKNCSIVVPMK